MNKKMKYNFKLYKWLLILLVSFLSVLYVSCTTTRDVLMLNNGLSETKLDVVELRKENICFNNELLGLLNQLPSNLNDDVTTYLMGKMSGGHIVVEKMIINKGLYSLITL